MLVRHLSCIRSILVIPSTIERVPQHTAESVNEEIRRHTKERIEQLASAGRSAINRRLAELDHDWDIERTLEANAAALTVAGAALALVKYRRFALVPLIVGSFLIQHSIQGWCPPLPVFRRLGVRTQSEIDYERYALKALRGDFRNLPNSEASAANAEELVDTMRR